MRFSPCLLLLLLLVPISCAERYAPSHPLHEATRGDPLWSGLPYPKVVQPKGKQELFDSMVALEAESFAGGLLGCEVTVDPDEVFDEFSGPDLAVTFQLGKARVDVFAPDNRRHVFVFVPMITLKVGDVFRLNVWEADDISASDRIADLETKYKGHFPIRIEEGTTVADCRALPFDAVQTHLRPVLTEALAQTSVLENARPSFGARDLSYPTKKIRETRKAITRTAAWVGWSASTVQELVKREKAAQLQWSALVVAKLGELNKTLPSANEWVEVEGTKYNSRVLELLCGERAVDRFLLDKGLDSYAPDCVLRVAVRSKDKDLRHTSGWRVWEVPSLLDVEVVLASGAVVEGDPIGMEVDARWVSAYELSAEELPVHELVLVTGVDTLKESPPQLLLAGRRSLRTPLRLPTKTPIP